MGMTQCCVANGETTKKEETDLLQMTQFRAQDPNKLDMNKMVSDASRRVREFKRTKNTFGENMDTNG